MFNNIDLVRIIYINIRCTMKAKNNTRTVLVCFVHDFLYHTLVAQIFEPPLAVGRNRWEIAGLGMVELANSWLMLCANLERVSVGFGAATC